MNDFVLWKVRVSKRDALIGFLDSIGLGDVKEIRSRMDIFGGRFYVDKC